MKKNTKIFLDSGDPQDTRYFLGQGIHLDGQTTNPSLVAKNPEVQERIDAGEKFAQKEIYDMYRHIVQDISKQIPDGSVSIEVYGDAETSADVMVKQARQFNTWIPNAHIKLPITAAGLEAAEELVADGLRVNMTLCFSEWQAAAVHAATRMATMPGQVFVSPFIGRLDDIGIHGVDLITNIARLFRDKDSHVQVLAASIRTHEHILGAVSAGADILTIPKKAFIPWIDAGQDMPSKEYIDNSELESIPFQDPDLRGHWRDYDIHHPLTDKGLAKFAEDWNNLVKTCNGIDCA